MSVFYLSLEGPIQSGNDDGFPSVGHFLTEVHNVWELQGEQAQCKDGEGQHLAPDPTVQQHQEQGKSEPCL